MEHLAIMKKSWRLTQKILTSKKKIESRWYRNKHTPWNRIKEGETVYFKDSGEPVKIKAEVDKVIQFADLTPEKVKKILDEYANDDGIEKEDIAKFFNLFKDKRYCILVFLKNSQRIKPFEIDKTGFGLMASWISIESIDQIKK